MLKAADFWGGSETNGGVNLTGGTTLQLNDAKQFVHVGAVGGSGDVVLKLPNSKGLRIGTEFRILFTSASTQPVAVHNYSTGAAQTIYDAGGVARTSIDFTTPKWELIPAIKATLIANSTADGSWTISYWGHA